MSYCRQHMKKFITVLVLSVLFTSNLFAKIEDRVIAYGDDGREAWFTFKYKSDDIFTLSFAGSGEMAGVWIVKGELLTAGNTICLLQTNDPSKKLQNLIKNEFMPKYGYGGTVDVDPRNTLTLVKGKISNTVLYYFLKAAQNSDNTKNYLKTLGC